jgi:hypothetical protein
MKAEALKSETNKKKDSSREKNTSVVRSDSTSYRDNRRRGAGGATLSPRPISLSVTAAVKGTDLADVRYYNYGKKGHFANIYRAP